MATGLRTVQCSLDLSAQHKLTTHRFPPPWLIAELEACFVVIDSAGQKLAYVYFEDKPDRRSAAKLLSKDEARRIAVNIAKLPRLARGISPERPIPEQRAGWPAEKQ